MSGYAGNGKFTEYRDKKDSWILKQMKSGKPDDGISVDKSDDEHIRFAMKHNRIASKVCFASCESYVITKTWKKLSSTTNTNFRFHLKWEMNGAFDGCTLNELEIVKSLVYAKLQSDYDDLNKLFAVKVENIGDVSIDFGRSVLFCDMVLSFNVNIVTDDSKMIKELERLGFESVGV